MKESGLTLKEAIESGRPFRSLSHPRGHGYWEWNCSFSKEEVLATDYELEPLPEEKIEITKSQLSQADAVSEKRWADHYHQHQAAKEILAKKDEAYKESKKGILDPLL